MDHIRLPAKQTQNLYNSAVEKYEALVVIGVIFAGLFIYIRTRFAEILFIFN